MNARILPPGMTFAQALRRGYTGEIRMPGYLAWLRTLPCHRCLVEKQSQASHPNFYKSQKNKAPDPLALPECPSCHQDYEVRGSPEEVARLTRAALYMLQAIYEGRLVWKST